MTIEIHKEKNYINLQRINNIKIVKEIGINNIHIFILKHRLKYYHIQDLYNIAKMFNDIHL